MSITPRALLVWIALSLIWGTTWLGVKIGLEDLPPFIFASMRFAIAALALASLMVIRRRPWPATLAQWAIIGVLGCLQMSLQFGLNFWGAQFIPSSLTAILFCVHPVFVILLAHLFVPDEPMNARNVFGTICGVAGVVAIFSRQMAFGRASVIGSLAVIGGALCSAAANIIAKRNVKHLDAVVNTAFQMVIGSAMLFAMSCAMEQPSAVRFTPRAVITLLYLSLIGSAVPFALFYWLMKRAPVTFISFIPIISTLVATLLGWSVLGEHLGWHTFAGGALIITGALLVSLRRRATSADLGELAVEVAGEA